jgi:hypothetical protein
MSKKDLDFVVSPSIPIVWFGDIEKYQRSPKRILTISINPSLHEFPQSPKQPRFDIVDFSNSNALDALYSTLNHYFYDNPYGNPYDWFKKYNKLMSVLDCSYGGLYGNKTNTAIHIDIYTAIATNPTFGHLESHEKALIQNTSLFNELFDLLDPGVVLISVNHPAFENHFNTWNLTNEINFPGPNRIETYIKNEKRLIWGTVGAGGVPFGCIPERATIEIISGIGND